MTEQNKLAQCTAKIEIWGLEKRHRNDLFLHIYVHTYTSEHTRNIYGKWRAFGKLESELFQENSVSKQLQTRMKADVLYMHGGH